MAIAQEFSTARNAALLGRSARRILVGGCTADPAGILSAVLGEPDLWQGRTLTGAFIPGVNERDYAAIGMGTRVETIFSTSALRAGRGQVDHLPLHYSSFWARLGQAGMVDMVYITVPPPGPDGTIGLGLCCDFALAAITGGAPVVGVVNPMMPDMRHGPRLDRSRFATLVLDETPLAELANPPVDADSARIAAHIISLLRPGDTLQLGLGKVQGAVLAALQQSDIGDLGYHAGMLTQNMLPLIDAGRFSRGVTTGVALGSADFYRRIRDYQDIRFLPVGTTHAVGTLSAIAGFTSINTVLEVDLTGQANAEWLNGSQVSGQGGLVDFQRGARNATRGRAILALPSTASDGKVSRIVTRFQPGTPVSVARGDADIVVTEYGIAELRDATLTERARRLIAIAAPAFRDGLAEGTI